MREIKFRYLLDNGWVYYALEEIESDETIGIEILDRKYKARNQYTGLKDKNGKEIYEGDILEYMGFDNKIHKGEVEFYNGSFILRMKIGYATFLNKRGSEDTIIGNIYENKELLNE